MTYIEVRSCRCTSTVVDVHHEDERGLYTTREPTTPEDCPQPSADSPSEVKDG